jgi:hypothetical protein
VDLAAPIFPIDTAAPVLEPEPMSAMLPSHLRQYQPSAQLPAAEVRSRPRSVLSAPPHGIESWLCDEAVSTAAPGGQVASAANKSQRNVSRCLPPLPCNSTLEFRSSGNAIASRHANPMIANGMTDGHRAPDDMVDVNCRGNDNYVSGNGNGLALLPRQYTQLNYQPSLQIGSKPPRPVAASDVPVFESPLQQQAQQVPGISQGPHQAAQSQLHLARQRQHLPPTCRGSHQPDKYLSTVLNNNGGDNITSKQSNDVPVTSAAASLVDMANQGSTAPTTATTTPTSSPLIPCVTALAGVAADPPPLSSVCMTQRSDFSSQTNKRQLLTSPVDTSGSGQGPPLKRPRTGYESQPTVLRHYPQPSQLSLQSQPLQPPEPLQCLQPSRSSQPLQPPQPPSQPVHLAQHPQQAQQVEFLPYAPQHVLHSQTQPPYNLPFSQQQHHVQLHYTQPTQLEQHNYYQYPPHQYMPRSQQQGRHINQFQGAPHLPQHNPLSQQRGIVHGHDGSMVPLSLAPLSDLMNFRGSRRTVTPEPIENYTPVGMVGHNIGLDTQMPAATSSPSPVVQQVHQATSHQCAVCPATFRLKAQTLFHQEREHFNGRQLYLCVPCCMAFETEAEYGFHQRHQHVPDAQPWACHCCLQRFGRKSSLSRHILSRHQQKRFDCRVCPKSYSQKFDCVKHERKVHNLGAE